MAPNLDARGQILLFSLPRTGCHLLERMIISKQKDLKQCWHPTSTVGTASFAMFDWLQKDDFDTESFGLSDKVQTEVAKGIEKWKTDLAEAQKEGQTLYMHDHVYWLPSPERIVQLLAAAKRQEKRQEKFPQPIEPINPTTVPSELLLHQGTTPIITIRHPVLTVPSNYRAMHSLTPNPSENNTISSGDYHCLRDLYDFYKANGISPVVVDADDYMTSEDYVLHICRKVPGLDPENAVLSWPKTSDEEQKEMNPHLVTVQNTLINSQGLVPGRASQNQNLAEVQSKWAAEFGEEKARSFKKIVQFNTAPYEYLRERRLRLDRAA